MTVQLQIFSGTQLRDEAIKRAVDHADEVHENWSEDAYTFLKAFVMCHNDEFMGEDVRAASVGFIPDPPSQRAWGAVMVRGKKAGIIKSVGFRNVSNAKAHKTPATVWVKA